MYVPDYYGPPDEYVEDDRPDYLDDLKVKEMIEKEDEPTILRDGETDDLGRL